MPEDNRIHRISYLKAKPDCMRGLRHTYATHTSYARSGRIDMVKENLGHEKYETTEIYIGTLEQSRNEYRKCMNGHWKSCMPADVRT